ncbi:MAG: GNAT family N-acetyltransferase [Gammaproteobacteria bacterium]|nr:GNAT family N-acetyltransferase [Rhodoferax sp.]MBU3897513.1 GNAT family N-acetyltransferase [Gammaproteobacteria bacterium]
MMLNSNIRQAVERGLAAAAPGDRQRAQTLTRDPQPGDGLAEPALSVEVLHQFDEIPSDAAPLFAHAEHENVESGLGWYKNLVKSVYPDHNGLSIYLLRKNDQAIALLPVLAQGQPGGHCIKALSNYYTTLYAPFFAPQVTTHDLAVLLKTLHDGQSALTSLQLAPMNPQARSYQLLLGALKIAGLPAFEFFCFGNWYLPVSSDWSTYFRSRESKIRNTIKRTGKAFTTAGGTLELVTGGSNLERAINAYLRVYAASWKQAEPYPDFMPGLIRACAERGWLRLGLAWLNGEAIAAQLWIVANGKASIYKLAYDKSEKKYAPGTLLTAMLMQHVIERDQVAEVDYLIGDDPYKKAWMSHRRERWGIVAYNPRTFRGLLGMNREFLGRAVKTAVAHAHALANQLKEKGR